MWEFFVAGAVGAVVGVGADRLLVYFEKKRKKEYDYALSKAFGTAVYVDSFDIADVLEWLKPKQDKLAAGSKAVVFKANGKNIRKYLSSFDKSGKGENYLIMAIVSGDGRIEDCVLIHYLTLTVEIENELSKGDGSFVVGS